MQGQTTQGQKDNLQGGARRSAIDEQTGKSFKLEPETRAEVVAATASGVLLVLMLGFFIWQMLDVWIGKNSLIKYLLAADREFPASIRLVVFAAIGGGLGGVINGIRGFLVWHAERRAFGWRFIWKYATLPPLGAVLAVVVYAIVRAGVVAFGGISTPEGEGEAQLLSALGVGALSGYGSQKVLVWLDAQVNRLFSVIPEGQVRVPALEGEALTEVEAILKEAGLRLGTVTEESVDDDGKVGLVIKQDPLPDALVAKGSEINVTVGKKP